MNSNSRNQLFELNAEIVQLYDSTQQKPGAESASVLNFYDQQSTRFQPRNYQGAPTQLTGYAAVCFGGAWYLIGGISMNQEPTAQIISTRGGKFSVCAELPFPLYGAAAAADEEFLVVFGGRTGAKFSDKLLVYDREFRLTVLPDTAANVVFDLHQKNKLKDWPSARSHAALAARNQRFYLFGGCGREASRELFELEIRKTTGGIKAVWTNLTKNIGPPPQHSSVFVAYDNALYLFDVKEGRVWRWLGEWRERGVCQKAAGRGWMFDGQVVWFEGGRFQVGCW